LSVYAATGRDIEIIENGYTVTVDRTLISRYGIDYRYERVYIDLDDTVIVGGRAHLPAVWFLHQCRDAGKEVVLLTRHEAVYGDTAISALEKCHLPTSLFDEIVDISADGAKADIVDPRNAIFIDNAFAERKAVHERHGIPVFDVDSLEVLLDWRM
jgi:hypothetical protein